VTGPHLVPSPAHFLVRQLGVMKQADELGFNLAGNDSESVGQSEALGSYRFIIINTGFYIFRFLQF
jgi:hypothetical protein